MTLTFTHTFLGWIIIGLLAGWLAGTLSRGHGFGCIANIVIGLIGALLGGWLFTKLGIVGSNSSFLYSLAAATVGAVVLVLVAGLFSGNKS
jgi:uncharacterized membrane protein YeaQ/YmgE (transglycosylase-associated protein family)